MNYRRLGATDLEVSEIGLGAWAIGGPARLGGAVIGYGPVKDSQAIRTLESGPYQGINLIDTADIYGNGHSEELIGKAFRGKREQVIICTRLGNRQDSRGRWRKDFSREHIRQALEGSLRRLRTDYVDIVLLHSPPPEEELSEEFLAPLRAAQEEGLVLCAGISVSTPRQARLVVEQALGDVVQVTYSLLAREIEELLPGAPESGPGILGRSPLASGFLAGRHGMDTAFSPDDWRGRRFTPPRRQTLVEQVERLRFLATPERTLAQAAICYALRREELSSVIVGARTPAQVAENAAASHVPGLSTAELRRIEKVLRAG